jgi:3-deoxy-D-manno-octulosonic-acid transferase
MNRLFYSVLWHLGLPLIGLRLLYRARKQPEYLHHLGERFGATPLKGSHPCLWLHAVSVGETRAAQPLIKALLAGYPHHEILLTHMTPTGRATGQTLFGNEPRVRSCYLPYDFPWAQRRFLQRTRPQLGIVMETEVWPNLLHTASQLGIPMLLANARLSERSARGYLRLGQLTQSSFARFAHILAQTEADAARLCQCGARQIEVCGNMKFDVEVAPTLLARGDEFRDGAPNRPIILAAATREGEEAPLLDAFGRHAPADALLVLVPRHPQRFDEVAIEVQKQGLSLQRRSEGTAINPQTRVWLGDSMGEMIAYYRMSDIAIIGGSWQPLGGQNLIEACAVGKPVLIGPHTFNFTEAAAKAIDAGAARRCQDLDEALATCAKLLQEPATRTAMAMAGQAFAQANQGATAHTLEVIADILRQ